uniref:(northern house mosquito) hypothetical protein n=1 Tax=Culex pipiens TaxID=7175 RepID=A0A8D8IRY2_CULPI
MYGRAKQPSGPRPPIAASSVTAAIRSADAKIVEYETTVLVEADTTVCYRTSRAAAATVRIINHMDQTIRQNSRVVNIVTRQSRTSRTNATSKVGHPAAT